MVVRKDFFSKKVLLKLSSKVKLRNFDIGMKIVAVAPHRWFVQPVYAHLDEIKTRPFAFITQNTEIGTVGNTGNAITTPAHLHYGIGTLIPYLWRIDNAPLGWQKMSYLNPIDYLK